MDWMLSCLSHFAPLQRQCMSTGPEWEPFLLSPPSLYSRHRGLS